MEKLTPTEIIDIGKLSVPIAANFKAEGDLFGDKEAATAASTIAIVTDALKWQYESFSSQPITPIQPAKGYITITSPNNGLDAFVQLFVNDPILGVINLGGASVTGFTTKEDIVYNIYTATFNNIYGYVIPEPPHSSNILTVIAPLNRGTSLNGGNNLYITIT